MLPNQPQAQQPQSASQQQAIPDAPGLDFFKSQPQQQPQQPQVQQQQKQQQEPVAQPDSTQQEPSADFKSQFKQYVGVDIEQFVDVFAAIQEDYTTRQINQYKQQLKEKLGEENFDERFERIETKFSQLSPDAQNWLFQYNPIERALHIHNVLEAEAQLNQKPQVPSLDGNTDGGIGGQKTWKRSEVRSLSPEKYRELLPEIDLAMREGRYVDDTKSK